MPKSRQWRKHILNPRTIRLIINILLPLLITWIPRNHPNIPPLTYPQPVPLCFSFIVLS